MATTTSVHAFKKGAGFLLENTPAEEIFTREHLSEEHIAIERTVEEFWANEVEPNLADIRQKKAGVALEILRKSAKLGLLGISVPEKFGGMEMDLPSVMVVAEVMGRDASYAGWHSAHTGIGSLPILFFGTEQQKEKYLPKLVSGELLAAYALTEPLAGSDALAARTRADLSADGKHYILNGQKMWITNGGAADVFIVFAKVGGEKFTAFIVERAFGGLTSGTEEHKMGIQGSSTTAIYFDNVKVPVENVLGEIGRGHVIAFNILNIGRLKLGPAVMGAAKNILSISIKYAKQRKAFGSPIAGFGAIQHKLAEMAIRIFATESMAWRVVGLIQAQLSEAEHGSPDSAKVELKAAEEYAAECSMVKVFAAEMLDYVADEGVQIHGGYGFHQDYAVERYYRDARINRLFEGTSEINRLVIAGMPLKRAARGLLPLLDAAQQELASSGGDEAVTDPEMRLVRNAKKISLFTLGVAHHKHGGELEKNQEAVMSLSDLFMETFAMESTLLRCRNLAASGKRTAHEVCQVFLRDAMTRMQAASQNVLSACSGDDLEHNMARLRSLARYEPVNAIALRRSIAERLLGSERYSF
ncbi:MAG TPA: acyl-CoA dehydrogenase family protein [Candidatus Angelobacter sp.]|jgi:alkylation response protein AidB-like acyl-CoA dehydrogenase|nr:acyl-CoA dehydrogenase family protein [Candidatus Angelobacter sp.]